MSILIKKKKLLFSLTRIKTQISCELRLEPRVYMNTKYYFLNLSRQYIYMRLVSQCLLQEFTILLGSPLFVHCS